MPAAGHWRRTSSPLSTKPPNARQPRRNGPTTLMSAFQAADELSGCGQGLSRIASDRASQDREEQFGKRAEAEQVRCDVVRDRQIGLPG